VKRITRRERALGLYKDSDLPWKFRDNALFVAYAPADQPRFAACVVVQHGGEGASAAAPVVHDLLIEVQKRAVAAADPSHPTWTG
jgi:penicillin-binding protein 2